MNRITSVDVFRTFAIIAVIIIHSSPFEDRAVRMGLMIDIPTLINQFSRFAVPLFFIFSGFFWASKLDKNPHIMATTLTIMKRIFLVFGAWSLICLLPTSPNEIAHFSELGTIHYVQWRLTEALADPITTLFQGTKVHLWFLVALLWCFAISALFLSKQFKNGLLVTALILYAIGLAGGAYMHTPVGISVDFNFRNGPFFGLLYFVTGYFLFQQKPQTGWFHLGLYLATFGFIAQFVEQFVLHRYWGVTMIQDYVIGTYPFALGMALIALSNVPALQLTRLAAIGPLVSGIYISHYLYLELLIPVDDIYTGNPVWETLFPIAVFIAGYLTTRGLSQFRFTKKLFL